MLSKPPFPSFSQFVAAVQGYDLRLQSMNSVSQKVDPNMAFSATRPSGGRGRGTGRGRGNFNGGFNSKGRGFFQPARTVVSIALTPPATQNSQQQLSNATHRSFGQFQQYNPNQSQSSYASKNQASVGQHSASSSNLWSSRTFC